MKLQRKYYTNSDVVELAHDLLGKVLFTSIGKQTVSGIITETEAYAGITDRASHAFGGRRTRRTEIMYSHGGTAYVYLCYGIHALFNIVTNKAEIPHAVLIRAAYPVDGIKLISVRRNQPATKPGKLMTGPGTVSKGFAIQLEHTGLDLTGDTIWLEDKGLRFPEKIIKTGPRIGVDYAGDDALLPYRFRVDHRDITAELLDSSLKLKK
ncbi:MAG: DNA-3-methyladenine glycosylase [Bacteroidia bacterium]